jgi:hypothetical protein
LVTKLPYLEFLQGRKEEDLLYDILDMEPMKKKCVPALATELFQAHPYRSGILST